MLELSEALRSADDGELMRRMLDTILQALIDAEASAHIGAARHERSATRTTQRNGSRDKVVSTTAGDLTVKIPKTRTGSFYPSLLTPRRRIDQTLHAVVMEAYVHGVSTRKVDDLVTALGVEAGISKSEVSQICAELDADVAAFTERSLDHIAFRTCSSTPPTARSACLGPAVPRRSGRLPGRRDCAPTRRAHPRAAHPVDRIINLFSRSNTRTIYTTPPGSIDAGGRGGQRSGAATASAGGSDPRASVPVLT